MSTRILGESTRSGTDQQQQQLDQNATVSEQDVQEEEEEEEVKKLEEEVNEIINKVDNYRSTLESQLQHSLSYSLASLRPVLSLSSSSDQPGPSNGPHPGAGCGNSRGALSADEDEKAAKIVKLFKDKSMSNITAMPIVLKRLNECLSRVEKNCSSDETIHPIFKRKKS